MPNQPRDDNRAHAIRFDDVLWAAVLTMATREGVAASEVVREAVRRHTLDAKPEP